MNGHTILAVLACTAALCAQRLQLDPSRAFFSTAATADVVGTAARTTAGEISAATYLRYLASHPGSRPSSQRLENLAFDFLLARECEARGLARSAPALAPALAGRRMLDSQRDPDNDDDNRLRARFATEALRELRIDALVGAARQVDEDALHALFDHRYGVDGVRVRVRHILVAREDAPLQRSKELRERLRAGAPFESLLAESDDRTTRRLLRDPATADDAGFVASYNYRRFGPAFAAAVRNLEVGEISEPVTSPVGQHLIQVTDRVITALPDVLDGLKKELGGGKATTAEITALRRRLLDKYQFRPTTGVTQAEASHSDWPHYRGNSQLRGVAPGSLGTKPELAWTFATGGEILSSPVIVEGTVYVGSTDNSVYAIDLESGTKKWSFATDDMVEAPPLVVEGRVFVGSSDAFFYALDARTGELAWKFETKDKILGGANCFRRSDGSLGIVVGSYDASVYCLSAATGKELWSYQTDNYVHGAPAIGNGEVVFGGCDAALHLVGAETGERIAKIDLGSGCQVAGSVALAGDKAYFGHYGNEFIRVDLESGATDWRYPSKRQGFCSSPAIGEKYVVVGGRDKQLHCIRRADGAPHWTFKTRRKVDGSPVICGDKVVFGSGDGRLYLLRLDDGEQLWSYDIGKSVYSSPAIADHMIVIGASDNRVYAFRAPPGAGK